jgi:threonine synthase
MTDGNRLPGATHLECTGTGDHLESEQLIGLSPVGKPLFARYDLEALKGRFTPDAVARPLAL